MLAESQLEVEQIKRCQWWFPRKVRTSAKTRVYGEDLGVHLRHGHGKDDADDDDGVQVAQAKHCSTTQPRSKRSQEQSRGGGSVQVDNKLYIKLNSLRWFKIVGKHRIAPSIPTFKMLKAYIDTGGSEEVGNATHLQEQSVSRTEGYCENIALLDIW